MPVFAGTNSSMCRNLFSENLTTVQNSNSVSINLKREYIQFFEKVLSQNVLFFKKEQYIEAVKKNEIPLASIIIVDELPLSEDVPYVSAIIIGKDLLLEATHIQVLAEKMGIPIIVSPHAIENSELKKLSADFKSFELVCKNSNCSISGSSTPFIFQPKIQSVLPKNFNRNTRKLYSLETDRYLGRAPRELSGDKYFELMGFKMAFPHRVPDISSVSSGYFESFLNTFEFGNHTMRRHFLDLNRDLNLAKDAHDEIKIKELLEEFQNKILTCTTTHSRLDTFDDILLELKEHYESILEKNKDIPFSIRSNQEVEDLIAAGLYKSVFARQFNRKEFEKNIRLSWASLWDYRSFNIRRYWGQIDFNLSTSLMVHPFIDNILAHSLGTFKIDEQNRISLSVNLVFGANEKATNPSEKAQTLELTISENNSGKLMVNYKSGFNKLDLKSQFHFKKYIEKAITNFYKEVHEYIREDFLLRIYKPTNINIEFIIQDKKGWFVKPDVMVLQYKPSLNKEVVLDILTGLLNRDDTDRKRSNKKSSKYGQMSLDELQLKSLAEVVPTLYEEFAVKSKPSKPRYALVIKDKKPMLIFWKTPNFHKHMKQWLFDSNFKWLKSGYLLLKATKGNPKPLLLFTETTEHDTDEDLHLKTTQKFFEEAIEIAMKENKDLNQILTTEEPEIIFQTKEGQVIVQVTADNP
jgi:hypothetical protein